jgi:hypothetical protein
LCRYDLGCRFSREEAVVIRIRADSEREAGDGSGDVQRRRAAQAHRKLVAGRSSLAYVCVSGQATLSIAHSRVAVHNRGGQSHTGAPGVQLEWSRSRCIESFSCSTDNFKGVLYNALTSPDAVRFHECGTYCHF